MSRQYKMWTCEACKYTGTINNKTNHLRTKKHKDKENSTGIRIVTGSVGKPRKIALSNHEKVKNPDSGREIKTNTQLFRKLLKKYGYDAERNSFLMYVTHPLDENRKIVKNDETFKKYKRLGYIYDDKENSFTIPSKKAESAFDNGMTVHDFVINRDDPLVQLNRLEVRTKVLLKKALRRLGGIKFNVGLAIEFIKNNNGVEETGIFNIIEEAITITQASEIDDVLNTAKEKVLRRIDRFTNGASGWAVNRITRHYVNINKNKPLRGSSYIPLPDKINNKQATINIQNKNDDKCFIYCLARRFDPNPEKNHLERVSKHLKKVCSDLKYDNIECPVTMKDIPKIEKQFNIIINIFGHNDEGLFPIKLNKNVVDLSKHIDLLITSNDEMNHYIWIKDFNRLCHTQTKHQGKKQ